MSESTKISILIVYAVLLLIGFLEYFFTKETMNPLPLGIALGLFAAIALWIAEKEV